MMPGQPFRPVHRRPALAIWLLLAALGGATPAFAQAARITRTVDVVKWRSYAMPSWVLQPGDPVRIVGEDGHRYWIILPRDDYGTRRSGWVPKDAVAIEPRAVALSQSVPTWSAIVQDGPAPVRRWRDQDEIVLVLPTGAVAEVIGSETGWHWVVLPPDAHGVRRGGWLPAVHLQRIVEPDTQP